MLTLVIVLLLATSYAANAGDTRAIDVNASHATFAVQHALIERVTGRIPILNASVTTAADGVTPVTIDATLDPRHIDSGDSDRDGDLQGPDWFDTQKFPTWTFKSTGVTVNGPGSFAVAGLLTVHGVGVNVVLAATAMRLGTALSYHATTHVARHEFGMAITRADVLVGNEITISLDVQTH